MTGVIYETAYSQTNVTINTTEWSLTNNATFGAGVDNYGSFWVKFALPAAAVAADEFTFKVYNKVDGTNLDATYSVVVKGNGARQNIEIKDPIVASTTWDCTLDSTAGTARTISWVITEESQQSATVTTVPNTISVDAAGTLTIGATGATVVGLNSVGVGSIVAGVRGVLVDEVWDEQTSGHSAAGSTGKALTDAGSAGDPWGTALPGAYGAGTAGKLLGDTAARITDTIEMNAAGVVLADLREVNDVAVSFALDASGQVVVGSIASGTIGVVRSDLRQVNGVAATFALDANGFVTVGDKTSFALSAAGVTAVQSGLALSTQVDTLEGLFAGTISLTAGGTLTIGATGATVVNTGFVTVGSIAAGTIGVVRSDLRQVNGVDVTFALDASGFVTVGTIAAGTTGIVRADVRQLNGAALTLATDASGFVTVGSIVTGATGLVRSDLRQVNGVASTFALDASGRVTVGSNADKTGYTLTTAGYEANADALLGRHIAGGSNVTGLDARNVTSALRAQRNKTSISAGTLTVTEEDDATTAWTAAVTTTAGDPISAVDPTGP